MAEDRPLQEWLSVEPLVYHESGRYTGLPRYIPIGKPIYETGTGRLLGRRHQYPEFYDKWGFPHRFGRQFGPPPNANANAPPFMEYEQPPAHSLIPQRTYTCQNPGCAYHGKTKSALELHRRKYHIGGRRRKTRRARTTKRIRS